jgi:hypothetical protein
LVLGVAALAVANTAALPTVMSARVSFRNLSVLLGVRLVGRRLDVQLKRNLTQRRAYVYACPCG